MMKSVSRWRRGCVVLELSEEVTALWDVVAANILAAALDM